MEFVVTKTANKKHIRLRHAGERRGRERKNNGATQYAQKHKQNNNALEENGAGWWTYGIGGRKMSQLWTKGHRRKDWLSGVDPRSQLWICGVWLFKALRHVTTCVTA